MLGVCGQPRSLVSAWLLCVISATPNEGGQGGKDSERLKHVAFAELHCISNYSFLRGASHPEEMVKRPAELGYQAIAITDEHNMGLYFKRMHVLNTLFGDEEFHLHRFANLPGFDADISQ